MTEGVSMARAKMDLQEVFDHLFIAPLSSHNWASCRGRSHWVELEGWQDSMAGPLSAIADTGGCDYVYLRNDWYFEVVDDPQSLRSRLLQWHAGLLIGVERFDPIGTYETLDFAFMQSLVERMRELVERACIIEHARWQSTRTEGFR